MQYIIKPKTRVRDRLRVTGASRYIHGNFSPASLQGSIGGTSQRQLSSTYSDRGPQVRIVVDRTEHDLTDSTRKHYVVLGQRRLKIRIDALDDVDVHRP